MRTVFRYGCGNNIIIIYNESIKTKIEKNRVLRLMEVEECRASRSSRFMKNDFDRKSNKRRNEFSTTRLKNENTTLF